MMINQIVSHYNITEKLGEGGMGVVYKARDTKLDRDVALKFLPESLTPTEEDKQRFVREAKAAAALSHPNICTIHNIDEHDGRQFIVMEYIEGKTLREKIDRGDLTLQTALDYGSRIADALAEAHEQDIFHRDIKPENIMVDAKGRIKVMDFGLAKLKQARDITKTGDTVGTLAYSSPEQIRGEEVDHRSDLFSLGIVLYEMLTGDTPFRGEHKAAMTYAIVNEDPIPISNYIAEVTEGLEQIIRRCLAKEPEDRYETANELLSDLQAQEALSATGNEEASEETGPLFSIQNRNSRKQVIGALAAVFVVIALLFGWWIFGGNSLNQASDKLSTVSGTETAKESVAVLPFEDFSPEGDQQWFSDGLTEEILNSLAKLPELQVPARTSSFIFRDSKLPIKEIADSLKVNHIVEGSVRRVDERLRITVQLIRAEDGTHLWSNTYNQKVDSVFQVQQNIAEQIASSLDIYLDEQERQRMFAFGTRNVEAYDDFLKGKALYTKAHEDLAFDTLWTANKWFEKAIHHDPKFATPHFYHHDAYVHYLLDEDISYPGKDSLDPNKAYEQIQQDLTSASSLTQDPGTRIIYELNKVFLSNNWSRLSDLALKLKTSPAAQQAYIRLEGVGWSWHFLVAGGYASLVHPLYQQIIKRDPVSFLPIYYDGETLASMGKADSAVVRFNQLLNMNQEQSISKMLSDSKFYTYLFEGNNKKAKSILSEDSSLTTQVKKMLVKKSEPNEEKLQLLLDKEIPEFANELAYKILIYFASGKMKKANELAGKVDAKIMGPQDLAIIASLNSGVLLYDLQSTPRLAERFEEAGIEVKPIKVAGKQAYQVVQKEL